MRGRLHVQFEHPQPRARECERGAGGGSGRTFHLGRRGCVNDELTDDARGGVNEHVWVHKHAARGVHGHLRRLRVLARRGHDRARVRECTSVRTHRRRRRGRDRRAAHERQERVRPGHVRAPRDVKCERPLRTQVVQAENGIHDAHAQCVRAR